MQTDVSTEVCDNIVRINVPDILSTASGTATSIRGGPYSACGTDRGYVNVCGVAGGFKDASMSRGAIVS